MYTSKYKSFATLNCFLVVFVIIAVTPGITYDPINPIKLIVLSAFTITGVNLLIFKVKHDIRPYKSLIGISSIFIIWQLCVLIVTNSNKSQQFFGYSGRYNGLLTNLLLILVFYFNIILSKKEYLSKFYRYIYLVFGCSITYSLIQIFDFDPAGWSNPYETKVIGFLGNPNFNSSLIAILVCLIFSKIFDKSIRGILKFLIILILALSIYIISKTDSSQGFALIVIGCTFITTVYLIRKVFLLGISLILVNLIALIFSVLGFLQKGPLSTFLYQESITYRGDYWRSGWNMTISNPLFGVGLDSYGDMYREFRSVEATVRRGPDVVSSSAHNLLLDLSASGGFPLLLFYLLIILITLKSIYKVFARFGAIDSNFVGIVAGWIALLSQSMISPINIALSALGWIFSGLIIGFEINSRPPETMSHTVDSKRFNTLKKLFFFKRSIVVLTSVVCLILSTRPYTTSMNYLDALDSGRKESLYTNVLDWPRDPFRIIQVAKIFNANNLKDDAINLLVQASEEFPSNYLIWQAIYSIESDLSVKKNALIQMRLLDPNNLELLIE